MCQKYKTIDQTYIVAYFLRDYSRKSNFFNYHTFYGSLLTYKNTYLFLYWNIIVLTLRTFRKTFKHISNNTNIVLIEKYVVYS